MKKYLFIFLVFGLFRCFSQNLCQETQIQYERVSLEDRRQGLIETKSLNFFSLHFLNQFNDTISVSLNEQVVFNEMIMTTDVSGSSEKYFSYNYGDVKELPKLKLSIEDNCWEIEIKKKFKRIYLFYSENEELTVRYSNKIYLHN